MYWARLENDTVMEIVDIDPIGRFHPSLFWLECPPEVDTGWTYDGNSFNKPLNKTIE